MFVIGGLVSTATSVIFNIVLLVIVWDDRAPKIDIIYVTPVNFFVTIFGVVFATGMILISICYSVAEHFHSMEFFLRARADARTIDSRAD
jgi:hypothetical protein